MKRHDALGVGVSAINIELTQEDVAASRAAHWRDAASRAISPVVVAGTLRLLDIGIIGSAGVLAHSTYLGGDTEFRSVYYLAILAGALLSIVIFHVNQLYR